MGMFVVVILVLLVVAFVVYGKLRDKKLLETVTGSGRGTGAERRLVLRLLKSGIPAKAIFHDLHVRCNDGKSVQIDVVVTTSAGIIVFEVKDCCGLIFGRGDQPQWTQVVAYGRSKYGFDNPVIHNSRNIEVLKKQLRQFEEVPFYSVIVFDGDCVLKDVGDIPAGTYLVKPAREGECVRKIVSQGRATYTDKKEVITVLRDAVRNGSTKTYRKRARA